MRRTEKIEVRAKKGFDIYLEKKFRDQGILKEMRTYSGDPENIERFIKELRASEVPYKRIDR